MHQKHPPAKCALRGPEGSAAKPNEAGIKNPRSKIPIHKPIRPCSSLFIGHSSYLLVRTGAGPYLTLGVRPSNAILLRQKICRHLRRSRPEKILNVFQREEVLSAHLGLGG